MRQANSLAGTADHLLNRIRCDRTIVRTAASNEDGPISSQWTLVLKVVRQRSTGFHR
jgi:hypothetical protein